MTESARRFAVIIKLLVAFVLLVSPMPAYSAQPREEIASGMTGDFQPVIDALEVSTAVPQDRQAPPTNKPAPTAIPTADAPMASDVLRLQADELTPTVDDRYGPKRNDPVMGIPDHAYSPFDELDQPSSCPDGGCEAMAGQFVLKLSDKVGVGGNSLNAFGLSDAGLASSLADVGVASLEPVFPNYSAEVGLKGQTVEGVEMPDLSCWYRAKLADKQADVATTVLALQGQSGVDVVEPDYIRRPVGDPVKAQASADLAGAELAAMPGPGTDPLYSQQWHLDGANVPAAWAYLESQGLPAGGSPDVIVAVIDTGVDYTHPDLAASMWINAPEFTGTPGVDDDGNGYVDDIYGADTVYPDGDPQDDHGHGTHVAGIIAAQANNGEGGVGVAYNSRIMALKAAQYSGMLAASDIAEAIYYAVDKGVDVINMSFGGYARSTIEEDALTVAFSTSVLVAAAGNDGRVNRPCPMGMDMYPAAYNWVLGVMASMEQPDFFGNWRAFFSNYDCTPSDQHEYELMAPGMDIWSTLPAGQYAEWDGTSMAAPVVAGTAALCRTNWGNKTLYTSRFIMGQIASNLTDYGVADARAAIEVAAQPELHYLEHWLWDGEEQSLDNDGDGVVDSGETIDLAIVIRNHWGKAENVQVTVDAWAPGAVMPDPYAVIISGTVDYGAVGSFNWDDNGLIYEDDYVAGVEHPFRFYVPPEAPNNHRLYFRVTMTADNGFDPGDPNAPYTFVDYFYLLVQRGRELPNIIDEDMTLTSDHYWIVVNPTLIESGVSVTVTEGTQVQFSAPSPDPNYDYTSGRLCAEGNLNFFGTEENPIELFGITTGREVYINNNCGGYGVNGPAGIMQYTRVLRPFVNMDTIDHCELRKEKFSTTVATDATHIRHTRHIGLGHKYYMWTATTGPNPATPTTGNLYEGCMFNTSANWGEGNVFLRQGYELGETINPSVRPAVNAWPLYDLDTYAQVQGSAVYDGRTYALLASDTGFYQADRFGKRLGGHVADILDSAENSFVSSQFDPCIIGIHDVDGDGSIEWTSGITVAYTAWSSPPSSLSGQVAYVNSSGTWQPTSYEQGSYPWLIEVPGELTLADLETEREAYLNEGDFGLYRNNAFLDMWWLNPYDQHKFRVRAYDGSIAIGKTSSLSGNFWGTLNRDTIDECIVGDSNDSGTSATLLYEPILEVAPPSAYPFASDVTLSTTLSPDVQVVGVETVTFTVSFNRDMDIGTEPIVTFGPDVPYTDYTIDGDWATPRTWLGAYDVNPLTGDGYQLIRVAGAVAADDPWLVTGDDAGRFRFEIITSGTESMNLQATGGEGYIDLTWTQDDFDLLSGFNMYRSDAADGAYTRINQGIIPSDVRKYRDLAVNPGQPYFYKFTVVKSDMQESDYSNVATATPIDTVPPVIVHAPVTQATPGLPLTINCDVTDNVRVDAVKLHVRAMGSGLFTERAMTHTTGDRYSATVEGSLLASPGIEYYISASDGVSTVTHGRADLPHPVAVNDTPVVTTVSPDHGPTSGGTLVTISGSNFKAGPSVTFGGAPSEDVVVLSSSQITATTPAHFPETVDVCVTNPGDVAGLLTRAYTYESDVASLGIPNAGGGQGSYVQVPINAANIDGLAAADLVVTYDASVLRANAVAVGSLTTGWSLTANTGTSGQVVIALASTGGTVTGAGTLTVIEYEVLGGPGATGAMAIAIAELNDGAIPVDLAPGTFSVDETYSIGGTVSYWQGGAGIGGVDMALDGDRLYTGASAADGTYLLDNIAAGAYELTPSKWDEANGISALDASLVLRHAAGIETLSGSAAIAGDVNKSGEINSMDAYYILQAAVGLIAPPFSGAGVVWELAPESRSHPSLASDQSGQDFTGILLGDPTGNWTSDAQQNGAGLKAGVAALSIPDLPTTPGATVTVPVEISVTSGEVYAADLALGYDSAILAIQSVVLGNATCDWDMVSITTVEGEIRLSLAGTESMTVGGEMVVLVFETMGQSGEISAITLVGAHLDEGTVAASLQDGSVHVNESLATMSRDLETGWNLVSFDVAPMLAGQPSNVVAEVLGSIDGCYDAVLGYDSGGKSYYPQLPPAFNDLKELDYLHGYWLKMNADNTLSMSGSPIPDDHPIPLQEGWNLVSYLPDMNITVADALASIDGQYDAVLGYDNGGQSYYPQLPPQLNDLKCLQVNHGYWIKATSAVTLTYPTSGTCVGMTGLRAAYSASSRSDMLTNTWCDVYSTESLCAGAIVPTGSIIEAVDPDGVVCGMTYSQGQGRWGLMHVYGDDPATQQDEGGESGDTIAFRVNGRTANTGATVTWEDQSLVHVALVSESCGHVMNLPSIVK